jgi:hypothetical protein
VVLVQSGREVVKRQADVEASCGMSKRRSRLASTRSRWGDAISETEEQWVAASAELNVLPALNLASAAELQAADSLADEKAIVKGCSWRSR